MLKYGLVIILLGSSFLFTSCATILKGYEDEVAIVYDSNEPIEVYETNGERIDISWKDSVTVVITDRIDVESNKVTEFTKQKTLYRSYIYLRSNEKHFLLLKTADGEQKISLYPKVGLGWVFFDVIFGGIPLVIDLYNGNLNHYDYITLTKKAK